MQENQITQYLNKLMKLTFSKKNEVHVAKKHMENMFNILNNQENANCSADCISLNLSDYC
jgi:glutathione peroxidase-family protein